MSSEPEDQDQDYILTKSKKPTTITKIEEKPKRQKTPEQIKQFADMARKRQAQLAQERKNKAILEAKILLKEEEEKQQALKPKEPPSPPPQPPQQAPLRRTKSRPILQEISESESDEEVIVIKKQKKPKKKTIIIEESESDEEIQQKVVTKDKPIDNDRFRSQQNKKSLITIHNNEPNNNASRFFI